MEDGTHHTGVWLACRLQTGMKSGEAFVRVPTDQAESPAFYVSAKLVRPEPLVDEADGQVRVTLLSKANGSSVVEVPGEPLSFGPRIEVPSRLLIDQ